MRILAATLAAGFGLLNVAAFWQAYRMTHFVTGGRRTASPEQLTRPARISTLLAGVRLPRPVNTTTPADQDIAYTTVSITPPSAPSLEGWFLASDESPGTIIAFAGYALAKEALLAEAELLHAAGWDLVLVDFRGCGGSDGSSTTLGYREADDVAAACEWARRRSAGKPIVLFGSSMGAAAVLRAVSRHRLEPQGLILERPFDRLLTTAKHRFGAMGLPSFPLAQLLVFWGGLQHGFNGFSHNPADYARDVRCPVLILHGDRDLRVNVAEVKAVAGNLRGPVQLRIFPGVGHESLCRARPTEYRDAVTSWLHERLPAGQMGAPEAIGVQAREQRQRA